MCSLAPLSAVRALITYPKQSRPLLMLIPSFNCWPMAPVFFILSEPAKSTKWNFDDISTVIYWAGSSPVFWLFWAPSSTSLTIFYSIVTVKMAWDLELPSFIRVELVCLWFIPAFKRCKHSWSELTSYSFNPQSEITPFFSSLMVISF